MWDYGLAFLVSRNIFCVMLKTFSRRTKVKLLALQKIKFKVIHIFKTTIYSLKIEIFMQFLQIAQGVRISGTPPKKRQNKLIYQWAF